MSTSVIVHGHFYQPPRENPWTGVVERDPKVRPFHDWNDRIFYECYRAYVRGKVVGFKLNDADVCDKEKAEAKAEAKAAKGK